MLRRAPKHGAAGTATMAASPLDSDAMSHAAAAPTDRRVILFILCLAVLIAQVSLFQWHMSLEEAA